MKLEDQVTSLELSQKLKELGVEQRSLYYWHNFHGYAELEDFKANDYPFPDLDCCAAFTVAELGELLPPHFVSVRTDFGSYESWSESNVIKAESFNADTEADARARMLIFLIENKLIKL